MERILPNSRSLKRGSKSSGFSMNMGLLEKADKIKPEEAKAISATAHIMTAEQVAAALVRALGRDDLIIIPNTSGKFIHIIKRFLPSLTERWIDGRIIKALLKELP